MLRGFTLVHGGKMFSAVPRTVLVVAVTVIVAARVAESVCSFVCWLRFLLFLLTGFPACFGFLLSRGSELHMVFVCHSCDLSTYSDFNFMISLPKGNLSLFPDSSPWKRESDCPISPFVPSVDELCGVGWSSPDKLAIAGSEESQVQNLAAKAAGIWGGWFPLVRVWAGRQAMISIL